MSLLSRVADNLYWFGRYLERAENTARLILAYSNLTLDLPKRSKLEWYSLVQISGADEAFAQCAQKPTEFGVLRFMIDELNNPGSIRSSLRAARENLRSTRDRMPREVSESMNTLYGFMNSNADGSIRRTSARHAYLRGVVDHCQMLRGYMGAAMTQDLGYHFIRAGRQLERADMTTRIMDVRLEGLLPDDPDLPAAFGPLQWMAVLRSLSAFQMFRRAHRGPIRGREVIEFLLMDPLFPRSVQHSLGQVKNCVRHMPRHQAPLDCVDAVLQGLAAQKVSLLSANKSALRDTIDGLQSDLIGVHNVLAQTYFDLGVAEV